MINNIKNSNHLAIIEIIKKEKEISRADIAKKIKLTPASITKITKKLISDGILKESKIGATSGGRPPILLTINEKAGYIIGLNLAPGYLEGTIGDLRGEILTIKRIDFSKTTQKEEILISITNMIDEFILENKNRSLYGIGLACHGLVDSDKGVSIYAPYYGWTDFNIKRLLTMKYKTILKIDNDVKAMAIGQKNQLISTKNKNFILVNLSTGIGSAIVIDDRLLNGSNFTAGEIGHIVVSEDSNNSCKCGKYGCLETYISHEALLNQASQNSLEFKDINEMLNSKNNIVNNIINSSGRYLGKVLGDLVNMINPEYIYIEGELSQRTDFIEKVEETIAKSALEYSRQNLKVRKTSLGSKIALTGSVTMVIDEIFNKNK